MSISMAIGGGPFNYASDIPPEGYVCSGCQKAHVKLWRNYNDPPARPSLKCVDCAGAEQGQDVSHASPGGRRLTAWGLTSMIGSRVPAMPAPTASGFVSYSSCTLDERMWWRNLPLR